MSRITTLLALAVASLAAAQDAPAPAEHDFGEPVAWIPVLANGDFARTVPGTERPAWWEAPIGEPRVSEEWGRRELETWGDATVRQRFAVWEPWVDRVKVRGTMHSYGELIVRDGRGGQAQESFRGRPDAPYAFEFELALARDAIGRPLEAPLMLELSGEVVGPEDGAAWWSELEILAPFPCPGEEVLRAEARRALDRCVAELLRELVDAEPAPERSAETWARLGRILVAHGGGADAAQHAGRLSTVAGRALEALERVDPDGNREALREVLLLLTELGAHQDRAFELATALAAHAAKDPREGIGFEEHAVADACARWLLAVRASDPVLELVVGAELRRCELDLHGLRSDGIGGPGRSPGAETMRNGHLDHGALLESVMRTGSEGVELLRPGLEAGFARWGDEWVERDARPRHGPDALVDLSLLRCVARLGGEVAIDARALLRESLRARFGATRPREGGWSAHAALLEAFARAYDAEVGLRDEETRACIAALVRTAPDGSSLALAEALVPVLDALAP